MSWFKKIRNMFCKHITAEVLETYEYARVWNFAHHNYMTGFARRIKSKCRCNRCQQVLVRDGYQFVPMPELIITRLHGRDLLAEPPPKKAFEKKKEQKGKQG